MLLDRLRTDLLAARKGRDALAVRVLRSAIATLENAEATPTDVRAGAVEAVALGVGTAEAERLVVGDDEARRLLRADHDDRVHLADTADTHGRAEEATQLRAEAGVLARYLS